LEETWRTFTGLEEVWVSLINGLPELEVGS
jgi:hypothetical protein